MRAMLVAAGFGTRLDPLTRELPKPAVPVGNRPVAWFGADHLARAGFTEIVVNTHHLGERLQAQLEACAPAGVRLRFIHEPRILGTGGGVRNAWRPEHGEDFVTWNAKLLFAPDVAAALRRHRESGAIATMVLRALPTAASFSPVLVDGAGIVRAIRATAPGRGAGLTPRMFTGVQVLHPRSHADLPEQGDIIEHAYQRWLARGEIVASVTDDSPWFDVGVTLRQYLDANLALARGQVRWPGIEPGAHATLVDPSANVTDSAELRDAVVGRDAHVAGGVRLTGAVLWPGARVERDLDGAIVTSAGTVVRA